MHNTAVTANWTVRRTKVLIADIRNALTSRIEIKSPFIRVFFLYENCRLKARAKNYNYYPAVGLFNIHRQQFATANAVRYTSKT